MRSSKSRSRSKSNRQRSPLGNIVNRVFDSSGPESKVRGTPQQIIDKYLTLARDAQLSNDRVAAENFLQHAEHYARMLGEAQREMDAQRQQYGSTEPGGEGRRDEQGEWRRDDRPEARPETRPETRTETRPETRRDEPREPRRDERRDEPREDRREGRRDDWRERPRPAEAAEVIDTRAGDEPVLVDTPEMREPAPVEPVEAVAPAEPAREPRPRRPRRPKAEKPAAEQPTPPSEAAE